MVASDVVLTSAHVVYSVEKQEYNSNIVVTPATSNGSKPYGSSGIVQVIINSAYAINPSPENDYAVIKLSQPLGNATGYLSLSTHINVGDFAQTAGYPGDRYGQMVYASGNINSISNGRLQYRIDTRGGQSGSPILNADNQVVGIHSGYMENITNHSALVSQSVVDLINSVNPASGKVYLSGAVQNPSKPVYRLYHQGLRRHHYTSDLNERNVLISKHGWKNEGVAWKTGDIAPVYRLYNASTDDHLLTTSMNEVQALQRVGWKNEGTAFQSGTGANVFRLYSTITRKHFYTQDVGEKNHLVRIGWIFEGIAFKGN